LALPNFSDKAPKSSRLLPGLREKSRDIDGFTRRLFVIALDLRRHSQEYRVQNIEPVGDTASLLQ
jgi:hypothetical protein